MPFLTIGFLENCDIALMVTITIDKMVTITIHNKYC